MADLYNGRVAKIANSFVFKEPVFTGDLPFLWDEITVLMKYGSDYRRARELLQLILADITGKYARQAKARLGKLIQQHHVDLTPWAPRDAGLREETCHCLIP